MPLFPPLRRVCARVVLGVFALGLLNGWAAPPQHIVLFIGDGMGFEHVRAARYMAGAPLVFEAFPHQAEMTVHAANSAITDSAASATAMATGHKVNNGVLSIAIPGDGSDYETALETLQELGKRTGLVTTTALTHATPAGFGAHATNRGHVVKIAADYLQRSRPHVLFGGGGEGLTVSAVNNAGYTVVTNAAGLQGLVPGAQTHAAGCFGNGNMPYVFDGLGDLPTLPDMTAKALQLLENTPAGFFLMVEGGRIDHAAHANDLARNVPETLAFAEAVQVAVDWAAGRDDTLILVTADHETGGLQVIADNGAGQLPEVTWSSGGHTDQLVPAYAWGVNAHLVTGQIDNTSIHGILLSEVSVSPYPFPH